MDLSSFEWLNDYLELRDRSRFLAWKIRKAKREELRFTDGDLVHVKLNGTSKGAHVMDNVPAMEAELADCKQDMSDIIRLIDQFSNHVEQQILKRKYIDGETLEMIAEELNYSIGYIRQRHADLHRQLDFIDEWKEREQAMGERLDVRVRDME